VNLGQLWRYNPGTDADHLVLVYESPGANVLDSPDQFVVTPSGGFLICEDGARYYVDIHPLAPGIRNVNRLIWLTPSFYPFEFAVNRRNTTELSGACFTPDGATLFVNI
jgi:secreted PhoX family phosphatase